MSKEKKKRDVNELVMPERHIKESFKNSFRKNLLTDIQKAKVRRIIKDEVEEKGSAKTKIEGVEMHVVKILIEPSGNFRRKIHPRPNREYKREDNGDLYDVQIRYYNSYGGELVTTVENLKKANIMSPLDIHKDLIFENCNKSDSTQTFYVAGEVAPSGRKTDYLEEEYLNLYARWLVHESNLNLDNIRTGNADIVLDYEDKPIEIEERLPKNIFKLPEREQSHIIEEIFSNEELVRVWETVTGKNFTTTDSGYPDKYTFARITRDRLEKEIGDR